jgi:HEAT repeat protein
MDGRSARILLSFVLSVILGASSAAAGQQAPSTETQPLGELTGQLTSSEAQQRIAAAVAIGDLGPGARAAVPALIEALRDPNPTVRFQAAIAVGCIGPEARAAVTALIATLKDGVFFVRGWTAFALGEIGPEAAPAVPVLVEGLKNAQEREFVRRQIASALGRIGPNAVSALVEALTTGSELARLGAVLALHQIGPSAQAAVPALTRLLSDPVEFVRAAAAAALRAIDVALK